MVLYEFEIKIIYQQKGTYKWRVNKMEQTKVSLYSQLKEKGNRHYVDEKLIDEMQIKKLIDRALNSPALSEEQRQVLKEFYRASVVAGDKKIRTLFGYIIAVSYLGEFVKKPYNEVTKRDLEDYILVLRNGNQQKIDELKARIEKGEKINKNTLRRYKPKAESRIFMDLTYIKGFFKFVFQTEDFPDVVKWIKLKMIKNDIQEDELLTEEDRIKLVKCGSSAMDIAFIALLSDSGARIDEILSANIGDIKDDEYGARFFIKQSKTKPRPIRLTMSLPYVKAWINEHPYSDDPESPLFINRGNAFGRRLKYGGARERLLKAKRRAGIKKRVNPHHFRHSRAGDLDKAGFNERDLRIFMGWSETSNMPSRYLHSGEREVDKKIREKNGFDNEKKKLNNINLGSKKCPRCAKLNVVTAVYCICGMELDTNTVMRERRIKADAVLNEMFEDKEFKEIVKAYMKKKMESE